MDDFELFSSRDSLGIVTTNLNNVISDFHTAEPNSLEEANQLLEEGQLGNLKFSHFLEQWQEILDIRVRYPEQEDLNVPAELGSSRHKVETLILDIDLLEDGKFETRSVPVVAKLMSSEQASSELLAYKAAPQPSLEVFALMIDETESMGSRRSSILLTIADSNLVSVETRLKAQIDMLEEVIDKSNFEILLNGIKNNLKEIISNSYATFKELHSHGIIHGDPASRNVLQDIINQDFLLCDFEAAKDINSLDSEDEAILQKGYELSDFLGSVFEELNKFWDSRGIDSPQSEPISSMLTDLNKEILQELQ
ncbi:hypothetical protein KC669_02000 [Candidatus Dojkabacteria bacterium]|uniref:Protein kinase domain-containing protein n=1 Tax=Candidatus Dojkabacteria bacterium TaxID=2099670 RepID=A0A955RLK3_9BACT|nr:hypothetical protein [Candidatus Dojkabacteria bacterium]